MAKRKQKSGTEKMYALGKKPVQIWVTPTQYEQLKKAASLEMRPVTQFVFFHAMTAMQKVVRTAKKAEAECGEKTEAFEWEGWEHG